MRLLHAMCLVFSFLGLPAYAQWGTEQLDQNSSGSPSGLYDGYDNGFYTMMANPIATNTGVLYQKWYGGSWGTTMIDPYAYINGKVSTARVGGYDYVVYSGNAGQLRLSWSNGGAWYYPAYQLDSVGGNSSAIVADPSRLPGPSVFYNSASGLTLKWWNGVSWVSEVIEGIGVNVQDAVVAGGTAHVFYTNSIGTLKTAWYNGSGWSIQTIDGVSTSGGGLPGFVDGARAVTDSSGTMHVFYDNMLAAPPAPCTSNSGHQNVRHAVKSVRAWIVEDIDGCGTTVTGNRFTGYGLSAVNAPDGLLHVFYADGELTTSGGGKIHHRWGVTYNWPNSSHEIVDGTGAVGMNTYGIIPPRGSAVYMDPSGYYNLYYLYGSVGACNGNQGTYYVCLANFKHAWKHY